MFSQACQASDLLQEAGGKAEFGDFFERSVPCLGPCMYR